MKAIHSPWQWNGNTLEPITKDPNTSAVFSILDADGGYGFLGSKPAETLAEIAECRQLIVTAPELLDAAQSALMAITGYTHQNDVTKAATAKLVSAIAKATGQEGGAA